jgi:DNA polymerase-1
VSLVFDLESNGLLHELDTIHCIAIHDTACRDRRVDSLKIYHGTDGINEALDLLAEDDEIIGHNIISFDIPALQKVYPSWKPKGKVTDTLVISRLVAADLQNDDATSLGLPEGFQRRMFGSHALKAWGLRMGTMKGDYDGGWETCNPEMLEYCKQDVHVTYQLYKKLMKMAQGFSQESLDLEHELAEICYRVGNNGWTFDVKAAESLYVELATVRIELEKELYELFEPWEVHTEFVPKSNNKTRGYVKGEPFTKVKVIEFNPNSRKHIHLCLVKKYGWKPKSFTPSGEAKVDETVLAQLPYPEAKKLSRFMLVQKRIAQLAEGSQAWLKLVGSDGKLRHTIVSGGTVSGRASHRNPNVAQTVSARAAYGKPMRELFTVPQGWHLCGGDLSQLELRCLAFFLEDGGAYAEQIMEGDIHSYVQKSAGLPTRDSAKTFSYSLLYGGGDALIGKIVGGSAKEGKRLKAEFDKNIPSFKSLKNELSQAYKRGYLKGLDGRKLFIRSEHKCLSQLLQSAGALLCKQWLALVDQEIKAQNLENDALIVAWVHDELQIACRTLEVAHNVGDILKRMAQEAGDHFGISKKLPIEADYAVGRTWCETH